MMQHHRSKRCYTALRTSRQPQDRTLQLSDDITSNLESLRHRLSELLTEHRDLDDVIARITNEQPFDQLQVQRLKKRRLGLKDEIQSIESELLPDIIA
jgi:hypothetical protein